MIQFWANPLRQFAAGSSQIVIGAMAPEEGPDTIAKKSSSLRAERIQYVRRGIERAGFRVATHFVRDYTASHAYDLLERFPDAAGYVCLSDELAVAIKHLLLVRGKPTEGRLIGFDGSAVARIHQIPSIDQHLGETGRKAVEALRAAFAYADQLKGALPRFVETEIEVRLQLWKEPSATQRSLKKSPSITVK